MKIIDCVQGGADWHRHKLGKPSASQFSRILTPGGKPSAQAAAYANSLLAELFVGEPSNMDASQFMSRGTALENAARSAFAFEHDVDVRQVGVCLTDDGLVAASPDGLVGENELLELKVPAASTQIAYLLEGFGDSYWSQAQGQMFVTERKVVNLYAWNPVLPPVLLRIERDDEYQRLLRAALGTFLAHMKTLRETLIARGCRPASRVTIPASMIAMNDMAF